MAQEEEKKTILNVEMWETPISQMTSDNTSGEKAVHSC